MVNVIGLAKGLRAVREVEMSELDTFESQYVAAAAKAAGCEPSEIADSALALMFRDCDDFQRLFGESYGGVRFWDGRQRGTWSHAGFPRLTIHRTEAGKVYFT